MQCENISIQRQRFQQAVPDEILRDAKLGDMRAHSKIYEMFSHAVFTLASGICRNQHCAEDVLHNTFIKLINKISSFEGRAPFGMWLRQIAVNESLMYLRKQKKHKAVLSVDEVSFFHDSYSLDMDPVFSADKQHFTDTHSDQSELVSLLNGLPAHVRFVLWLKEAEGYTHEEIAKLVDKTPSYSKTLIARTYKYIRNNMSQPNLVQPVGKH